MKEKINEDWWSPSEKRFADFISDQQKAVQLIDMALQERVIPNRNEWARKELTALKERILKGEHKEKGFTVFYNASCLLPIKEGIADRDKALQMLDEVSFFTNKFGIYVAGIARPDDITLEECSKNTTASMGISTTMRRITRGDIQLSDSGVPIQGI